MKAASQPNSDARKLDQATAVELAAKIIAILLLISGSIVFATPFYIALSMSLKSQTELAHSQVWLPPARPTLENYDHVLHNPNIVFALLFKNSLIISLLSTAGAVLSASFVAYGFARINFRGRDRWFMVLIATMMLPGIVTFIPQYLVFAKLHWVNTFLPLIVPAWFGGGAFNIFLFRQFFMGIPRDLDEAAIIDGANHFVVWSRIILPSAKAALATVGILGFIYSWRDFLPPLIYLNDVSKQTLEVGLNSYNTLNQQHWYDIMAASVFVILPLVILFFVGQRYFVRGIQMTGIK